MQNGQEGFAERRKKVRRVSLAEYIVQRSEQYAAKGQPGIAINILNLKRHCEAYKPKVMLDQIDTAYLKGFVTFLEGRLALSTVTSYFNYMGMILNNAKREGLIPLNPIELMERHERPHHRESNRCYLTLEEVRRLGETRCSHQMLKQAFMFACFTGLRLSDVKALAWDDIVKTEDGYQIQKRQKKTKDYVYIPLSENAIAWMPPADGKAVFPGLPVPGNMRPIFDAWCDSAGITKHVTFHVSRHTFATLALTYGADLYTVSKLLGHADISTTQIYAKVVDENKRKAVNLIPAI